jgi:hypothetical protein
MKVRELSDELKENLVRLLSEKEDEIDSLNVEYVLHYVNILGQLRDNTDDNTSEEEDSSISLIIDTLQMLKDEMKELSMTAQQ